MAKDEVKEPWLIMTPVKLKAAYENAMAGDEIVYFETKHNREVGLDNTCDGTAGVRQYDVAKAREIRREAMVMHERGLVSLVQRRVGGKTRYIAQVREV